MESLPQPPNATAPLKAIAFRCLDNTLGTALLDRGGALLHLAGHLRADTWNGRTGVQFMIDDAASVGPG